MAFWRMMSAAVAEGIGDAVLQVGLLDLARDGSGGRRAWQRRVELEGEPSLDALQLCRQRRPFRLRYTLGQVSTPTAPPAPSMC